MLTLLQVTLYSFLYIYLTVTAINGQRVELSIPSTALQIFLEYMYSDTIDSRLSYTFDTLSKVKQLAQHYSLLRLVALIDVYSTARVDTIKEHYLTEANLVLYGAYPSTLLQDWHKVLQAVQEESNKVFITG